MKAISLRIRMQTLSPCLTPSLSKPPAMRAARSATSAWLRLRLPLMMPKKSDALSIMVFFVVERSGFDRHGRTCSGHPRLCFTAARKTWITGTSPAMTVWDSNVGEARRALVDIGAHRLELIGPAHQFHLLDGFG